MSKNVILDKYAVLDLENSLLNRKKPTILISVNYHLTRACNYQCLFCYARFPQSNQFLPLESAKKLIEILFYYGMEKITFVGGEPFLYPGLGELVKFSKELGLTTMIVTNGSLLKREFLNKYGTFIDWIGFSIDSGEAKLQEQLGRRKKGKKSQKLDHIQLIRKLVPLVREYRIKIKINTVITSLNWQENMKTLLKDLEPDRWKVFQVLKVQGENNSTVESLLIEKHQFESFIDQHREFNPIAESNESMIASYIMVDPLGRFFDNRLGYYTYSRPILEVGVSEAFNDISFSFEKMIHRGGIYKWSKEE